MQVHRLDEATGGLLLVAKTRLGLQSLSSSFEQRQVLHSSVLTRPLFLLTIMEADKKPPCSCFHHLAPHMMHVQEQQLTGHRTHLDCCGSYCLITAGTEHKRICTGPLSLSSQVTCIFWRLSRCWWSVSRRNMQMQLVSLFTQHAQPNCHHVCQKQACSLFSAASMNQVKH